MDLVQPHTKTTCSPLIWICFFYYTNYVILEGMAPYGCLLLAPAEGWWPSATWIALDSCIKKFGPPFFYRGPLLYPPAATPLPLAHSIFFTPIFFIGPPLYLPPCRRPPYLFIFWWPSWILKSM